MKKYSETHEWVQIEGSKATVGITKHAQQELGDIVYVELPEIGKSVSQGGEVVVLESTKAAADVYSPLEGSILSVNTDLADSVDLLNESPEENGWLYTLEIEHKEQLDSLLDQQQYNEMISQ